MTDIVLQTVLKPLDRYLQRLELMEISALQPGEVWLETITQGYMRNQDAQLTWDYWRRLVDVLANLQGQFFDLTRQPRLSTTLPGGHRFEALLGNAVEKKISISIRLKRPQNLTLGDYGLSIEATEEMTQALHQGANIIISGGTSSGKTTVLNTLAKMIPLTKRILTIEDTREIDLPHEHQVNLRVSRTDTTPVMGYPQMIDHILRSRPDVILAGEVSIPNAYPLLNLLNTGHKGFICTIHANSPELALEEAFDQKVRLAGIITPPVGDFLKKTVDLVLHVEKTPEGRKITDILRMNILRTDETGIHRMKVLRMNTLRMNRERSSTQIVSEQRFLEKSSLKGTEKAESL